MKPSLHCISAQVCSHVDLPGPLNSQSCASTIQRCSVVVHTCNPIPWDAGKGSFCEFQASLEYRGKYHKLYDSEFFYYYYYIMIMMA